MYNVPPSGLRAMMSQAVDGTTEVQSTWSHAGDDGPTRQDLQIRGLDDGLGPHIHPNDDDALTLGRVLQFEVAEP
jgi:hypothetical protein